MKKLTMLFNLLIILNLGCFCNSMLVKGWGTSLKINWLRWSLNDIFSEAMEMMTLGQKGMYPVSGFDKNLTTSDGKLVQFEAYNGWLENLQLDEVNTPGAELRRVIMTRAERYLHEKAAGIRDRVKDSGQDRSHNKHEMIICFECMTISIKSLHYAFRAEMNSTEDSAGSEPILHRTTGTLINPEYIQLPITFQMSIMINHLRNEPREDTFNNSNQANKKQCTILLEPVQLTSWKKWWPIKTTRIGRFGFLADYVDSWLEQHFNNFTLHTLRNSLDASVRKVLHTRNICLEILLKDGDYVQE